MDLKKFNIAPLYAIDQEWALLTSGGKESYNTMTISWGGLGTIWNKPIVTVYVRPNRYTYKFMESNDFFTISFFSEQYHKDLSILGTKSGKNIDKIALTKITPMFLNKAVTFNEANLVIVCKKIYCQDLDITKVSQYEAKRFYTQEPIHRMYFGEIIEIIDKR